MTPVFWIAISLAAVVFVIFAGWPLYATYKTRGQGADVAEGQAYFQGQGAGGGQGRGRRECRSGPRRPSR